MFVCTALISNVAVVYMTIALLIRVTALIAKKPVIIVSVSILILITLHMFNILDIFIFRIFKYHIIPA